MGRTVSVSAWALVLAVVLSGCSDLFTGPHDVARIGIVDHFGQSEAVVELPDTVTAGEAFTVTVRTYGGGCTSKGSTRVEDTVEGGVLITPIDVTREGPDVVCPGILKRLTHEAAVTFEATGERTVTVRGRRVADGVDEVILLDRTVEVVTADGS